MARTVNRLVELFLRQKTRTRSLNLKLRQSAGFVLVDFSLRERRIANHVSKQVECLVQVLNQSTRADDTRQGRQSGSSSQGRTKRINLFGNVFAGPFCRAFTQQRSGKVREAAIVSLVGKTTAHDHELHVEGRYLVHRKQD